MGHPIRPRETKGGAMAKRVKMGAEERLFMFSSESVNEGHGDKLADQVSDAVLDACLTEDPYSKVACETATKDNMVMVFGEITTQAKLDYDKIVRAEVKKIGFDSFVDDLSSVDSKGLSCDSCEVLVRINKQSPDIAGGVHVGKSDLDVGAGDQGIMFGYASDETESWRRSRRSNSKMVQPRCRSTAATHATSTSTRRASSSLAVRKATLALLVVRSLLTHTVAGEHTAAAPSREKIRRRSIALRRMRAAGWPSRSSRLASASARSCSSRTPSASLSPSRSSLRLMALSRVDSLQRVSLIL